MTEFYVGAGTLSWLGKAGVPLFFAFPAIMTARKVPKAAAPWALDSGGYNELMKHAGWSFSEVDYVRGVRHLQTAGQLDFVCPMDWPCAPPALAVTGKTVLEHQFLTIKNYVELTELAPEIPWAPVIQGWDVADYHRHVEMYDDAGVDLRALPRVTIGTIAARQGDPVAGVVVRTLHHDYGLRMHGLGVKGSGLAQYSEHLASADSRAWTLEARVKRGVRLCDDPEATHAACSGCLRWAVMWRERIVDTIAAREAELAGQEALFQPDDSFRPGNVIAHRRKVVDPFNAAQQAEMAEGRDRRAGVAVAAEDDVDDAPDMEPVDPQGTLL